MRLAYMSLSPASSDIYQAVQLRHRALAARLAYVPDLHAAFATRVDVAGGVADGHCTDHLPMAQCVDLAGMTWNAWANQSIWRKRHRLHLSICAYVKGVCSVWNRKNRLDT